MNTKFLASMLAVASFVFFSPVFGVIQPAANQSTTQSQLDLQKGSGQAFDKNVDVRSGENLNIQTPQPSNVNADENDAMDQPDSKDSSDIKAKDKQSVRDERLQNFRDERLMRRDFRAVPQPGAVDDMKFQRGDQFRGNFRGGFRGCN